MEVEAKKAPGLLLRQIQRKAISCCDGILKLINCFLLHITADFDVITVVTAIDEFNVHIVITIYI
ncbi:hypothetical protein D3C80_2226170 [compost metagenome]